MIAKKIRKNLEDFARGVSFMTIEMMLDAPKTFKEMLTTSPPSYEELRKIAIKNYQSMNNAQIYGKIAGVVLDIALIGVSGYYLAKHFGAFN